MKIGSNKKYKEVRGQAIAQKQAYSENIQDSSEDEGSHHQSYGPVSFKTQEDKKLRLNGVRNQIEKFGGEGEDSFYHSPPTLIDHLTLMKQWSSAKKSTVNEQSG